MRALFMWLFFCMALSGAGAAWCGELDALRQAYRTSHAENPPLDKVLGEINHFLDQHPGHTLALVYKGSIKTRLARQATMPWKKMMLIDEGFKLLDQATAQLQRDSTGLRREDLLDILVVSGMTNAAVPKSFGRRPLALRDLKQTISFAEADHLPLKIRAAIFAWLAVVTMDNAEQEGRRYLAAARAIDRDEAEQIWRQR